jgi:multimeric flavodoxin WrbA
MENTELLVKEALCAAEARGAEVAFIRAEDLELKDCTGCIACVNSLVAGGNGNCIIKDDLGFLSEEILKSDAVIYGSPVYVLTPSGMFKTVVDRFGPARDQAFKFETDKERKEQGIEHTGIDPRFFKKRYGAQIVVGGASTPNWLSLAMPLMNLFAMSQALTVVDQLEAGNMLTY